MKSFLREERTDSFPKFSETTLWFSLLNKTSFSFAEQANAEIFWRLKRLLDSSFLVFKNLFLSFDLFIIPFLSSLVIKLQLFERIYLIFLERACQEQITQSH